MSCAFERFTVEVEVVDDGRPGTPLDRLQAALKRLRRNHGIRCRSVRQTKENVVRSIENRDGSHDRQGDRARLRRAGSGNERFERARPDSHDSERGERHAR